MGNNYVFSMHPTFTQGLILGQLSILVLLGLILKYLFLDSTPRAANVGPSYQPRTDRDVKSAHKLYSREADGGAADAEPAPESTEWFNLVLQQLVEAYRSKLRNDSVGPEGDEISRRQVEEFVNKMRPAGLFDTIQVHSVDLGMSAPRLSNARTKRPKTERHASDYQTEFDVTYTDTISVSLSTAYLFNYPKSSFARLPVSLTISLSLFSSTITLTTPTPSCPAPALTISIPPTFTLDLDIKSLLGSRAILADVPKLHELIEHQVRRTLARKGTWKVVLPGLASVLEVKEDISVLEVKKDIRKELVDILSPTPSVL
ncbi:hypothetical protein EWM64_g3240 [Hericium alpestre]|uniref:Maintenance of mitochondrial morphology protein 1 n=1 Tax=Hericium alpestre TaxID=135208 RepID=A0A4Z0A2T1_9AGAM|nr:hypothetical protein EWM64_g3240 [Hericium alpestre]